MPRGRGSPCKRNDSPFKKNILNVAPMETGAGRGASAIESTPIEYVSLFNEPDSAASMKRDEVSRSAPGEIFAFFTIECERQTAARASRRKGHTLRQADLVLHRANRRSRACCGLSSPRLVCCRHESQILPGPGRDCCANAYLAHSLNGIHSNERISACNFAAQPQPLRKMIEIAIALFART